MATEIKPTKTQETEYTRQIKKLVLDPLRENITKKIAAAEDSQAAWQQAIDEAFLDPEYWADIISGSPTISADHIEDLALWQKKKMQTQFKQLYEIDISTILNEQHTRSSLIPIVRENISLIKSIPEELHAKVNEHFNEIALTEGFNQDKILRMLTNRFEVSHSRAKLIARDQTSKTIGALAQIRQNQVGVDQFIWRTSEDEKVRPTHRVLNNLIFYWHAPPANTGIPGHDINCRCVAIPYIPQLFKDAA